MEYLDKFRLDKKVALVTGASGLLGREFCAGLVEAGAHVAVVDIDLISAESLATSLGDEAKAFSCDVSDPDSVANCVTGVIKNFGKIDILLNNAATKTSSLENFFRPFEDYSLTTWREVMSVNIDGMFLMAQAVGKHMVAAGSGTIVQTASIYGVVGPDNKIYEGSDYLGGPINTPAVYSASKSAVVGLTRWLSTYWADKGIRVNCLVPGGVFTGQNKAFTDLYAARTPMSRMAESHEIVPALLYLVSDASSYVTGQVVSVDGGWTAW
jgi:NAD(P)-dependent dehydrogenase (short-subunit alcohol dehydrogenase family)